jgi:hypothetical protein
MADMTLVYVMALCFALILTALAVTAYEFRRMSRTRSLRYPLALRAAPELIPARVQTGRTRDLPRQ